MLSVATNVKSDYISGAMCGRSSYITFLALGVPNVGSKSKWLDNPCCLRGLQCGGKSEIRKGYITPAPQVGKMAK